MPNYSYLISLLFSILFFFTSSFAQAQLLWEISGNQLTQKSYLFGTIHVGDKRVIDYASQVYPYMDNSKIVAGELDLNFMTSIMAISYVMSPRDSTLSKLLSKEEYQEIKPYLAKNIGQLAPFLDMVRPVFIMALLQEKEQEQLAESLQKSKKGKSTTIPAFPPLDMHLQNRARKNEQTVIGLETVKEQMTALNSTSIDKQARELYNYIVEKNQSKDSTKMDVDIPIIEENDTTLIELENSINPMEKLILLYLSENIELLHNQISNEFEEETYKLLIVKRNSIMVKRMEEQMKKESKNEDVEGKKNTLFAAVGAGHLGGEEGMVNLLKKAGYTLKPLFFNKKEEIKK